MIDNVYICCIKIKRRKFRMENIKNNTADKVSIKPQMLKGTVSVPASKSALHRGIIAAALSGGKCTIKNVSMSQDIEATLRGIKAFGCKSAHDSKARTLTLSPQRTAKSSNNVTEIDCGESGSTLRFLIPIALVPNMCGDVKRIRFIGHGRLMQRPLKPYIDMFDSHGISYKKSGDTLELCGTLKSGAYEIEGNLSSQFITGLLFALPLLDGDSEITVLNGAESKGYIDMTINALKQFGIEIENRNYIKYIIRGNQKYKTQNFIAEADYSQAAFFLVAGAIGCDIECLGLSSGSLQGDREIINIIKKVGGKIVNGKNGGICAKCTSLMRATDIDASEIPDLVPILAVLLSFCKGESRIYNAGRLRMKESDRLAATAGELSHLGVNITEGADSLTVIGGQTINCGTVSSRHDHRIAMALAIAACRAEGDEVRITDAYSAVKKSYPDFFDVYRELCK